MSPPLGLLASTGAAIGILVVVSGCASDNGIRANQATEQDLSSDVIANSANRRALFERGVAYRDFIKTVDRRQAMWLKNTSQGEVPVELTRRMVRARSMDSAPIHLLAVAEAGCSDSANILPYLARFVDESAGLDMRIVDSRIGREVMNAHKTPDGRAATPTIVVLDSEYNEIGCLIERPKVLQDWALENRNSLPGSEFMKQKFAWYDDDLGKSSMAEIVDVIENAGTELVNCGTPSN